MQLSARFTDALTYATELHATQTRKTSGVPYVAHLLAVASLVLEYGGNEDETIAALLHDAIEDQGGASTREKIRDRFGDNVTAIVDGCTETDVTPKPPWRERKEASINHLANNSPSVRLVAAADKLHNIRSLIQEYSRLGESLWDNFKGGKEGTLWYYQSVADTLEKSDNRPIIKELKREMNTLTVLVTKQEKEV